MWSKQKVWYENNLNDKIGKINTQHKTRLAHTTRTNKLTLANQDFNLFNHPEVNKHTNKQTTIQAICMRSPLFYLLYCMYSWHHKIKYKSAYNIL